MRYRIEQPTLFALTACDAFEPPRGIAAGHALPGVAPESDPSTPQGSISPREPGVFRAVSPWASMPLHEVCASCGREITGSGFVILDYEELGAFCDQDCGDRRFRFYLYEEAEKATS
jgi:hypothetical protein